MDRSIGRLPDPVSGAPNRERRRSVRQKLHSPVYASFNGSQTGMVVDLSELLDLHEEGFAVQTSERLEMNRAVTLCLDLPETKSYIHGSGQVIWSDDAGRGGIRFAPLPENSRRLLKEWLFANLLIACANRAARTEQLAWREEEKLLQPALVDKSSAAVAIPGRSERLSPLETVRREVHEIGDDFDAALQLITERAMNLTGAGGAALAFLTPELPTHDNNKVICRASAGELAPPIGAPVNAEQGLSGECIRNGLLVSCTDLENDPRVDPEIGRALGIGALMAVPIVSDFKVVGLLEVFSPHPRAFTRAHATVLERLVEMIPAVRREKTPETARPASPLPAASEAIASVPPPPVSASVSSASVLKETSSIRATPNAVEEKPPVAAERVSPVAQKQIVSEKNPVQVPDEIVVQVSNPVPPRRSSLLHLSLLGLAVAVVALVVGYLSAPLIENMIEKRTASPHASLTAALPTVAAETKADGSPTDHTTRPKSLADLRKFADQGDADAQYQMGVRYHDGADVPQDDAQAVQWFQRAAEQGNVTAQGALGAYYWRGRGVPEDLSKAYFWSVIAVAQGDEISKGRLEGLASQMTREQVASARQQAEEWIHTHSERAKSSAN